jgi:hypothetical protein
LSNIVEFIRDGGLEASRTKDKAEIQEERRRLLAQQSATYSEISKAAAGDEHRLLGIAAARSLIKFLVD